MNSPFRQTAATGARGVGQRDLALTAEGLFLGDGAALVAAGQGASGRYRAEARPPAAIAALIEAAYGEVLDAVAIGNGLGAVARAIEAGDLARASIAAVHLRLPSLADEAAMERLARADRLLKAGFDPDEPRNERGRWTAEGGGAADAPVRVADSGQIMSDAMPHASDIADRKHSSHGPAVDVKLPDGSAVPDPKSPTGNLRSPVADLNPVAEAGRELSE